MAASLDSMVVGEPQILGQVKEAFAVARAAGTVSGQLEHLLQSAFAAAKKARSETGIGSNSVSIASVAVDLARKIFGSLEGRTVFLVGAGKMSEIAARHLVQQGAGAILVCNRTAERARRMAEEFQGAVVPEVIDLRPALRSRQPRRHRHQLHRRAASHLPPRAWAGFLHKRRNRPMFFIDIAVPRDVDPEMNKLDGIFVYDIDDLQQVAVAHMEERSRQAGRRRGADRRRGRAFPPAPAHRQRRSGDCRPAKEGRRDSRCRNRARLHSRLGSLTAEQLAAVEALTRGLVNKFLHPPMQALKQAAREGDAAKLDALCEEWSVSSAAQNEAPSTAGSPAVPNEEPVASPERSTTGHPQERRERDHERNWRRGAPMKLRIGSRGSQLALWQANHIAELLRVQGHEVEIEIIKTTGDRLQEVTFAEVGSKGMFTKEIEEALAEAASISLCTRSRICPPSFPRLCARGNAARVDPRDVFVSVKHASLAELPRARASAPAASAAARS
jgi:glutamyl-tRNA reductase